MKDSREDSRIRLLTRDSEYIGISYSPIDTKVIPIRRIQIKIGGSGHIFLTKDPHVLYYLNKPIYNILLHGGT